MIKNIKEIKPLVCDLAFDIIFKSEEVEGYDISQETSVPGKKLFKNIDQHLILEFLRDKFTKVKVVIPKDSPSSYISAYNELSHETIHIKKLGDHFIALLKIVTEAQNKINQLQTDCNTPILTNEFIKDINKQILLFRYGEVAIGEYRDLDLFGRPVEVHATALDNNGDEVCSQCVKFETSRDGNVKAKMNELINWVNNEAFKDDNVMKDIAEFHTRFIKIHPFRDGNGRTARLLTNYLLLILNMPLMTIPSEEREKYIACIAYALAPSEEIFRNESKNNEKYDNMFFELQGARTEENKYLPLANLFSKHISKETSKEAIIKILTYDGKNKFSADEISM